MGDYPSPKRRDLLDKLRKRMDVYRRHHNGSQQRYFYGQKAIYEQEKQHSLLLRQKILESKAAKKATKSKSKSDTGSNEHRNQIVNKKLIRKLDQNSADNQQQVQQHVASVYSFDDDDGPTPAKAQATATSTSNIDTSIPASVPAHIAHQINGSSSSGGTTAPSESKISTNTAVNPVIASQQCDGNVDTTDANVECKEEPNDDNKAKGNVDIDDEKDSGDLESDLAEIFKAADDKNLPTDLMDELKEFDAILTKKYDQDTGSGASDSGLNTSESGNMFGTDLYMDPSQSQAQGYRSPPGQGSGLSEGGRAAEALKRMANQHQQIHQPDQFGVKSAIDPFSDLADTNSYGARNGFQQEYYNSGMGQRSGSAGPYTGMSYSNKQQAVAGYGQNKQITPYSHHQTPSSQTEAGPSSLQQLQNQVAHFNHGPPHMEITQTQHMQVSDGANRMQLSQTQQIQLRQPPFPNISLSQQQGFSAAPGLGPAAPNTSQSQSFMGDQMSLQQQQMMQSKMHPDQRQAHMQQYMNRPPPEYKMQNGMSAGMASSNGMGPNPLQTIQNMVNQTNTHPNQAYSSVKSESSEMQNGMRTAQMSAMSMQQQQMGMSMSQAQFNYSNQAGMQRQASYPGAMAAQGMPGRPPRQNTPNYTSAIMRNQRPPNVNIGPDGLNISQPRHPQEWAARGMNPMASQGVRPGVPSTSANMMHYRSYSTPDGNYSAAQMQMHHQNQRGMGPMDGMQSQQAAMMQHGGAAHAQQMIMQQQRMQMGAQMGQGQNSMSRQTPPYTMSSAPGPNYPQTASSQDDILNLLDSNQTSDFGDVNQMSDNNWCDIEAILSKT